MTERLSTPRRRLEGLLVLAKAAGVGGLDSAIARMAADKTRTSQIPAQCATPA